jgi:hypothetical protein
MSADRRVTDFPIGLRVIAFDLNGSLELSTALGRMRYAIGRAAVNRYFTSQQCLLLPRQCLLRLCHIDPQGIAADRRYLFGIEYRRARRRLEKTEI